MSAQEIEAKTWLVEWFAGRTGEETEQIRSQSTENYFDRDWIDSFQFIDLLADIEEEFGVEFEEDDFQDRDFATLDGLAGTLQERLDDR